LSIAREARMHVDRWSLLALLRFALAAIVAMVHLGERMPLGLLSPLPLLGGFEAVLGFLVISGYCVTVSLHKQPEGFLRRRLRRVMPAYLVCLALTLCVTAFVQHHHLPGIPEIVANALLLNQLVTQTSLLVPAWSLSLECWFYALLPLLAAQPSGRVRQLAWLSFAAFVAFTVGRTLLHLPYFAGVGYGANLALLAFAWFTGCRLARGDAQPALALRDLRWMFAAHILLDVAIQAGYRFKHGELARFPVEDLPGFCLQAITLWVVVRCLADVIAQPTQPRVRSRWMNTLGDWSYPLYLVHVPVYTTLVVMGCTAPLPAFALALAAAAALHRLVEQPLQRRSSAAGAAALAASS
jgi:peptidoglycan/LPS O-acetylase OafA/YrhL